MLKSPIRKSGLDVSTPAMFAASSRAFSTRESLGSLGRSIARIDSGPNAVSTRTRLADPRFAATMGTASTTRSLESTAKRPGR